MKYKAVLFDLDGTLLPMDNDIFTKGYFTELAKKLSPLGIAPEELVSAVWAGTKAMVKNKGQKPNCEIFWETFSVITEMDSTDFRRESDNFYSNEFANVKKYTGENLLAVDAVRTIREKGIKVICASNPIFPLNGQIMRLSWIGLNADDFDYISSYESESFCKPDPEYYKALCRKAGVEPAECFFVGNDEEEDMYAAESIGIDCYLINDWKIPSKKNPWKGRSGTFEEFYKLLKEDCL